MRVVVWIAEATWPACVDSARAFAPADAEIVLVHVAGDDVSAVARGAFTGLLGRGHPERDPGGKVGELVTHSADELIQAATDRIGRAVTNRKLHGHVEREVVAVAANADLLILARDGDVRRQGPHSLGPACRYVVDHAACPVLLVWPAPRRS
jgi:nucleotide-binding universal stress UspA family protein